MTAWPLQQSQSDSNDNDDGQLDDADSPDVRVPTAAETVEHLQRAILCENTRIDSVKIMQLRNFLSVMKRAH